MSSGGHNKVKCSVESTRRIDIRLLQKAGVFNHDCYYNCAWTNRGRDSGSMRLQHLKGYDFITALYVLTHNDTGVKENREDRINLAHITTGYGSRAYFVCPECGERRIILSFYNSGFKCRVCARLNYHSSQMNHDGFTKPDNYIEKICKRLQYKIDNICDIYHVPKPKRMRQYTYERLIKELRHWQRMRNIAFVVGSDKILKRGGWVDGR